MNDEVILWGDINIPKTNISICKLNEYYKYKFKMLGEELVESANKLGKNCTINIDIKYEDIK